MKQTWLAGMNLRLDEIYSRIGAGEDVPPALQLGAEGYAEAGLELGLCDRAGLAAMVEQTHQRLVGEGVMQRTGMSAADWIGTEGRPNLPVEQKRAPVYPGTRA